MASSKGDKAMEDWAIKGCVFRIKSCAFDILSMEEDLINEEGDDNAWSEIIIRDLHLKSTFMYCDLNHVISNSCDEQKRTLTDLGNRFFYYLEELDNALKSRSKTSAQICYNDAALALQEVLTALIPSS